MQQQADASCVKQLGAGWVAEGVDDKMPYGASCRPVSDCAKATDLYDKCKTEPVIITVDPSEVSAAPVPIPEGAQIGDQHHAPSGDKQCQVYWKPIIDKVCKGGLQAEPVVPAPQFKALTTPPVVNSVRCGLDTNKHIVPDDKGGCVPPPPNGYIIDAPTAH